MKYVRLGPTGTKVSQFCIGGWQLPGSGELDQLGVERVDRGELERIMKKAFDKGINFIDTANRYHGRMQPSDLDHAGNSERLFGEILKSYDRESWVIATKVRAAMASWPNGEGLSRKHIMWQIRESLGRLQTNYVDLYQIHSPDKETPKLETLSTLNQLIDQGWVRYIGESNHQAVEIDDFMQLAERRGLEGFATLQEPYNLLERGIEKDVVPVARKYGLAILAYFPVAQGVLTEKYLGGIQKGDRAAYGPDVRKKYLTTQTLEVIRELNEVAKQKGVLLPQLALSWMLHKQQEFGVTIIPIVGVTRLTYLEENLGALDVQLSTDDVKHMEEISSRAVIVRS